VPDLAPTIAELHDLQRQRVFCIKSQLRQNNATGALVRSLLGWSLDMPEKERKAVEARAKAIIAAAEKGAVPDDPEDAGIVHAYAPVILAAAAGREPWDVLRRKIEKRMEALGRQLPVWLWVEGIRGFGPQGLAVVIGEAGDLSHYATPAKLWKRMGLARVGDCIQGKPGPGATADDWIEHGYNPRRRSVMWNVGEALIKGNGSDGRYRRVYDERKLFEVAKAEAAGLQVVPSAKIPAKRKSEFMSRGHVHKRAQRYMEKRLLKHLWQAWNRQPVGWDEAAEDGKAVEAQPVA
jgi:hypothetical protein